jgi:hypothetical protein
VTTVTRFCNKANACFCFLTNIFRLVGGTAPSNYVNSKKYDGRINNSMMYSRAQYGSAVQIRELKVIKSDGHG